MQIAFHGKVFSEAVQCERSYGRRLADVPISRAQGERNRTRAGENLRGVVKKNLVHNASRKSGPVDHGSAFNDQARDFAFAEACHYSLEIGPSINRWRTPREKDGAIFGWPSHRYLLHDDAQRFQIALFVLLGEAAKDDEILSRGLDHARVEREAQLRIKNDAQQRPASRKPGSVG